MCCNGGCPANQTPERRSFTFNNVNAYYGRMKEWLRRFHGVATRRTLEALLPNATSSAMILGAIGIGPYQQQTR
jgi:hypothetical protein